MVELFTIAIKMPKRFSYTGKFKLEVVKYAEDNGGNRAAGRQYAVSEKLVRDWRRNQDTIKEMPRKKRARRGKDALWPELERELIYEILDAR
jgi:transposase-like protein